MGNPDLGATGTHGNIAMHINQRQFERFSNAADEVFAKVLSSFLDYEVLVVDTDRYDIEFSMKAAIRKCRTEDSSHIREIEVIDNRNVHSHFNNNNNLVKLW